MLMSVNRRRQPGSRQTVAKYYLFVEGETEKRYFESLNQTDKFRGRVRFEITAIASDPRTLVEKAIDFRNESTIDSRDSIWCVFDVEMPGNHPTLSAGIGLAETAEIKVAFSNPSFETWLILHSEYFTAASTPVQLKRRLENNRFAINGVELVTKLHEARNGAINLERKHRSDLTQFPNDNPSTYVYKIFDEIEKIH